MKELKGACIIGQSGGPMSLFLFPGHNVPVQRTRSENGAGHGDVVELEVFADERGGELPQGGADDGVQGAGADDKVRGFAVQPEVAQDHLHILLDLEERLLQAAAFREILGLENQVHGGNGGLDLVGPEGVVVGHVLEAAGAFRRLGGFGLEKAAQKELIVRLDRKSVV